MKKLFLALTLVFSSMTLLTGCGTSTSTNTPNSQSEVNKKAEAVKATKATLEGIVQGNKQSYEDYYGAGKYDEKVKSELAGANLLGASGTGLTSEQQEEYFKLGQSFLSKARLTFKEKSEAEVFVHITPIKLDQTAIKDWATEKVKSGALDTKELSDPKKALEIIIKAVNAGEIKFIEGSEIVKTVKVKEKDGKFEVDSASQAEIVSAMFIQK